MDSTPRRSPLRALATGLLTATLLGTAGASCLGPTVETRADASFDIAAVRTFAWGDIGEVEGADGALADVLHQELDRRLDALGWQQVPEEDADVLVSYRTLVETLQRTNDPYFDFYAVEQYELGTLTIDVQDVVSEEPLWSGSASGELRLTAVVRGPSSNRLKPVQEKRDWQAAEKVEAILAALRAAR